MRRLVPLLVERRVAVIFVGTPAARRRNPGLDVYLAVSDREDLQDRITQFASHVGVQYALDALFGCMFSRDYEKNLAFLRASLPYTRLPAPEEQARRSGDATRTGGSSELGFSEAGHKIGQ